MKRKGLKITLWIVILTAIIVVSIWLWKRRKNKLEEKKKLEDAVEESQLPEETPKKTTYLSNTDGHNYELVKAGNRFKAYLHGNLAGEVYKGNNAIMWEDKRGRKTPITNVIDKAFFDALL